MRRLLALVAALALALPAGPARAEGATLAVSPASAPQRGSVALTMARFDPKETVSLWLTFPDYRVSALGDVVATAEGAAAFDLTLTAAMPVGVYAVSARGNRSGLLTMARLEVTIGAGAPPTPGVTLTGDQSARPQGTCFRFKGAGYASREAMAVWLRLPDGSVTSDGLENDFLTDSAGGFSYEVCFKRLAPEGGYALTAYGKTSERTGIAELALGRGDYLGATAGRAVLFADPPAARQLDAVAIVGGGFEPGEKVSLWLTMPNGVVVDLFAARSEDGTLQANLPLTPAMPAGTYYVSAYGQRSGERAVAPLKLLPGDGG